MKQQIICETCSGWWEDYKKNRLVSYEHIKMLEGNALSNYKCDGCYKDLPKGTQVIALSVWSDLGGIAYFPWESDYIKPEDENRTET